MSSSFLYLAIVAVWAFILVPRWLRRQHAQLRSSVDVEVDVEYAAEYDPGPQQYYYDDIQDAQTGDYSPDARDVTYAVDGDVSMPVPRARSARAGAAPSRTRVLRARRRLLTMLLLLTAVAGACTTLKVTSWWVVAPPAGLLVIYLVLLREAALADAEQARRRAPMEARVRTARQRAYAEAAEAEVEPSAQIIDISARVGDQLYDQYADAAVRAVGD